ncbi:MAG: molybdopterin-dependent oxidoreductase [bacterium]|nr:molybdopterin-dependent oxidoreductase [bacterium]
MSGVKIAGRIDGEPFELDHAAWAAAPEQHRVPDLSTLLPGRDGAGVRFAYVLDLADPPIDARWVTIESRDGAFAASLPIEEIANDGIVVHERDGAPLGEDDGGPFCLYIPGYRDACANVKFLTKITFASAPGADTRPSRNAGGDCKLE